ncbi:MAG TPA: hypothetical protein VKD91_15510 [Pyrinomonadaceae bacterium]|nr:hypothetical protein [Pyrinomonadaceae bacterium]
MRKSFISALLFPILLALTIPVGSQTRPRRVEPPTSSSLAINSEAREAERPRVARARTSEIREGAPPRTSRWPGILLGTGIAIGLGRIGHGGVCSPSRGVLIGGPRFVSNGLYR